MKLTAREKALLLILAFLVLNLGALQLVYTPLKKQQQELSAEALQLEDELAAQQVMINSLDALNATHQDLQQQLQDIADQFVQPEFAEQKDEYLHETLKDSIKIWNSLTLSDIGYAVLPQSETELSSVLMVEADFTVSGTLEGMIETLDKIQQLPQVISVSAMTVTRQDSGISGTFHIQFYTFNHQ